MSCVTVLFSLFYRCATCARRPKGMAQNCRRHLQWTETRKHISKYREQCAGWMVSLWSE